MAHSIICPTHGPLIDLKQHCHNLAQFFISANPYDFDPVTSWLKISSGITEVKFISDLFDPDVMWCGSAMEYEDAKSEFHSRLICELTRFIFIWGGIGEITYVDVHICLSVNRALENKDTIEKHQARKFHRQRSAVMTAGERRVNAD